MMNDSIGDILIVDDLPANLNLLSGVLTSAGYKVRPAPSGKLALRAAENNPPDLIMLDISMPEMDGFEVCRKLKENPDLAAIPVIFISALTDTLDKVKAFDQGGVDYVTKPFEPKEVLSRVKAHCMLRRALDELDCKNRDLEDALDELKNAQTQIVQHEKMASLGVMTAGIAHEINNPINFVNSGVKGLVGIQNDLLELLDGYEHILPDLKEEERESINQIKQKIEYIEAREAIEELTSSILSGVKRTAEIVEGLRVFSHTGPQGKKLIDIRKNIDSALMLLKNRLKQRIELKRDYSHCPMVLALPGSINQVFMNVISNAIDAVDRRFEDTGGEIVIKVYEGSTEGERGAVIDVSDNGFGISDEVLEHIFEPFFTTNDVGDGVGLGLSISHGIVKEHRGTITVVPSETGACFRIWLPLGAEGGEV